jgi:hypothetical protein
LKIEVGEFRNGSTTAKTQQNQLGSAIRRTAEVSLIRSLISESGHFRNLRAKKWAAKVTARADICLQEIFYFFL